MLTGLAAPLPARASCAGPELTIAAPGSTGTPTPYSGVGSTPAPTSVRPGQDLVVDGQYFLAECNDVMACARGCAGCTGVDPPPPMRSVSLVLIAGDEQVDLGEQDATDEVGGVTWEITVPPEVPPGPAVLEARWNDAVVVEVPLLLQQG